MEDVPDEVIDISHATMPNQTVLHNRGIPATDKQRYESKYNNYNYNIII